jgi:diguanylate cyclase (GGDEF)-like protein
VRANGSTFVVAALHDITERRHANIDLRKQAGSDPLTGLANRRILMQRMQRAMGRPLRNGVLAVLYTDLDHFKVINDTFGHHIGDLVLVHMAERLTRCLRAADTLARLGGDEFVVMAEGVADERAAVQLASRINLAGRETFWVDGHELVCTLSVGVAWTADPKRTALALLNEADAALYRAKALGRDRAAVFDDGLPS